MTKEEEKQMAELIKSEQKSIKELRIWSSKLKQAEVDKERDILDRYEAYKYRIDSDNVANAKEQQVLAYMNIHKNLKDQAKQKKEEAKLKVEK